MRNPFRTASLTERFDREWRLGDRAKARAIAEEWVAANPEATYGLDELSIPELVSEVEAARAKGNERRRLEVDMYILARVPKQTITGEGG